MEKRNNICEHSAKLQSLNFLDDDIVMFLLFTSEQE